MIVTPKFKSLMHTSPFYRVKACTEENQQLQKRIRTLEAQNESLLVQMRRFQSVLTGGGNSGRSQVNASTALMMLILSAALFIVPSVRQDAAGSENDLSLPASKMPSAGGSFLSSVFSGFQFMLMSFNS